MKIATFNVNGVNGRLPVLLRWLEEAAPDVVCLQELKAPPEKFPEAAIRAAGYGAIWQGQKSWNGVAILARGAEPIETRRGLPGDPDDAHSRYIEAAVERRADRLSLPAERQSGARPEVRLQAALVRAPGGACGRSAGDRRAGRPRRRLQRHADRPRRLQARALARRRAVPPGSPRRRSRRLVAQGWTDALRALHPGERIYTFWDYFRNAYGRDAGLRIDHLLLSPIWRNVCCGAEVDRPVRGWEKTSDHAPVWIELEDSTRKLAGAAGFEPAHAGTKNRCLTAWLRPNSGCPYSGWPEDGKGASGPCRCI